MAHNADLHATRIIIERFLCRMKDLRKLVTDFEKLGRDFLSTIHLFTIRCRIKSVHTLMQRLHQWGRVVSISGERTRMAAGNIFKHPALKKYMIRRTSDDWAAPEPV